MVRISRRPCRKCFNSAAEWVGERQRRLLFVGLGFCAQMLTGSCDCESFFCRSFLIRNTFSTSFRRYIRWPVLLFTGLSWGNSVSQNAEHTLAGAEARHFTDAEVQLLRDDHLSGFRLDDGFAAGGHEFENWRPPRKRSVALLRF